MTRISSRNLANQFIKNKKLTKSKRFYVYNLLGKRKCRVLDLTNINGEQKLVLVYYYTKDNKKKITNPKIPINDNPIFEEIEDVGDEDDEEIGDEDENPKKFGGNKKSRRVKKNKKRTNKKRTNKKY
jgi:hypothetical protein